MVYNIDELTMAKRKMRSVHKKEPRKWFCFSKIVEFCKRTDLHGYKYIVMKDLNKFERLCWAFAVSFSLVVGIFFVITAYRWYAKNPIITVIESTQAAIWDMPFPAVTICDINMISRKAALDFAKHVTKPENVSEEFLFEILRYAPLLHSTFVLPAEQKRNLYILQTVLDLNSMSIKTLFKMLSPVTACDHLIERCMWKNTVYRCSNLFQPIFTMQHLCCTFNYFATEPTDPTYKSAFANMYPRRVASCGYQTALTVLVNTDPSDYYSTLLASQGALVFIDDPNNVPDMDSPVRLVSPFTEVMIALSPERTYSTSGIRSFSPEQRQCYYIDEIQIGAFRQYSFHNCIANQKVEYMLYTCRCVPFYFPSKDNYRTCNFYDIDCLETVLKVDDFPNKGNSGSTFRCLPECEHFNYQFEVAVGTLSKTIQLNGHPFFNGINLTNRSLLNVFFNDLVSTKYRRDVYLNWQNLLASFGGLLSLMLGFTLISGFDLILFTLRATFNYVTDHIPKEDTHTNKKGNKIGVQGFHKENAWLNKTTKTKAKAEKDLNRW